MTQSLSEWSKLSIGKVIDELGAEFPELSITKIRYLESEGLIEPERTSSGYRKFSYSDVERLRFILRHQRDKFWPLGHIRQVLEDMDQGIVPPETVGGAVAVPNLVLAGDGLPNAGSFAAGRSQIRLSRAEILDSAGISEEMLDAIEQYGLVSRRKKQTYYDGAALSIAATVAEFAKLGLEPRHLRIFKTAADREIGLFDQIVSPVTKHKEPDAKLRVEEMVANLAALSVRLHTLLVRNGLSA
ncbi:MAG TPA: MerR family transcriptional regulator [Aeromicrobium sp.]|nr:MerR family transcriptional regulator [Aeromicrobium sp.]